MIDARDETQIGRAHSFDGTLDDIFALQRDVARQIAEALAVRLLPGFDAAGSKYVPDPRAYEAYLAGRFEAHKKEEEFGFKRAIAHYERAFELDPELPEAHVARAYYLLLGEWRWNEVDDAFRTALAKKPVDPGMAYHWWGHYLTFAGRDAEAIAAFDTALRMDPLSALHAGCLGGAQVAAGRIDAAERSFARALRLNPDHPVVRGSSEGYVAEINLAQVHAGLGETDKAFEMLEIAVHKREPWILALRCGPGFDTIRDDPRFIELLRRIGVSTRRQ